MINTSFLKRIIEDAIETYNKLHKPEAEAKLIEIRNSNVFIVEFNGVFCFTCGVRDWIEDLVYIFKSMGYDVELIDMIESGDRSRTGIFKYIGESSGRRD
ncbi:MAG: hypothetical protein QXT88_01605 [Desulfurococcaceae archaeon]